MWVIILNIITMILKFKLPSGVYERCLNSIFIYVYSNANVYSENKRNSGKIMKECRYKQRNSNWYLEKTE